MQGAVNSAPCAAGVCGSCKIRHAPAKLWQRAADRLKTVCLAGTPACRLGDIDKRDSEIGSAPPDSCEEVTLGAPEVQDTPSASRASVRQDHELLEHAASLLDEVAFVLVGLLEMRPRDVHGTNDGALICLCVYKRGANEVKRRLAL